MPASVPSTESRDCLLRPVINRVLRVERDSARLLHSFASICLIVTASEFGYESRVGVSVRPSSRFGLHR